MARNMPLPSSGQLSWLCPLLTWIPPPGSSLAGRVRSRQGLDAVQALLCNS